MSVDHETDRMHKWHARRQWAVTLCYFAWLAVCFWPIIPLWIVAPSGDMTAVAFCCVWLGVAMWTIRPAGRLANAAGEMVTQAAIRKYLDPVLDDLYPDDNSR